MTVEEQKVGPIYDINPSDHPLSEVEFGTEGDEVLKEETVDESDKELEVEETPMIPPEVYDLLPEILKTGSEAFRDQREKDVFLLSALTLLSGCFPTVYGIYDSKMVNANMFTFIIAPAASGKSALITAKEMVQPIHDALIMPSTEDNLSIDSGTETGRRILFIPGNISAAAVMTMLNNNTGLGIICETEADTLSNCFKQEWGGFSDVLRKAFHHEHVSYARKLKNQFIEIPRPKLSILLSGTPNQLHGIIRGIEDGLFSRFVFYKYKSNPKWRDPSPKGSGIIFESYMKVIKDNIKKMYDLGQAGEYRFDLSSLQWDKFNEKYTNALNKSVTFVGDQTASNIFRLGLINYRIAMVLSVVRHFESGNKDTHIECSEIDYSISDSLSTVILRHGLFIFKALTRKNTGAPQDLKTTFYSNLPILPFQRKAAIEIGNKIGIAERTVNKYLAEFTERGFLKHSKGGPYEKISGKQ